MTTIEVRETGQADETLTASQAALKELADQKFALDQHAIVAVTDVQGTILSVNDKFCAISQYSKEELIGQNHRILNSGHHPKEFFQQMYRTIANGEVWHGEIKNRAKDGSVYWVDTTIVPFVGGGGKPRQYVAIRADITERKAGEQALKESLAMSDRALKELADQKFALDQHAIVAVTDVQGTISYVNEKFCAISQYPKEELIGQNHRILNSGHHPREFFQQMYRTIASGQVWHGEIQNRAKGGSIYWVDTTIVPFMNANGKPRQYVAIRADITERKGAEEAARQSLVAREKAIKELADQKFALDQHAIVAVTDVQGTITYVNDKFCTISQYSKEELIGGNHRILNSGHHPKEFFQAMYHTIASGQVWHGEIKNRAKDGSIYWVDTTIVPSLSQEGKPRQYVAIRADITERKRAEDALIESLAATKAALVAAAQATELKKAREALASANQVLERSNIELQQFAYIASHDLQSPLRSIGGFVQLLRMEYENKLDERASDWIRRIVQAIDQMQTLIRDLLAYSQVDSRSRPFGLAPFPEIFNDAAAMLESSVRDSGGRITCGDLPVVFGDRSQLVQLMQNLIGNGLKYHGDKPPHVHVAAELTGSEWTFSVRDNGIGIEPRYFERIFEIFKRLHDQKEYPGTGIGLAVCRRVVTRHGGRIWVESEPGHGTVFHFTIPEGTDKTNEEQTYA
jgi:PAS domain S-box-containing protein